MQENIRLPFVIQILWAKDRNTGTTKKLFGEIVGANLYLPTNYVAGKRYPLVIQTHGWFTESFFNPDGYGTTADAAMPLAGAGIMVLQGDWIGSVKSGLLDEAAEELRGFQSGIKYLSDRGMVDPTRVGVIGFSRTCWDVQYALVHDPHLFSAASINDGVTYDYANYALGAEPDKDYESIYGGPPLGKRLTTWMEQVPGFHLDNVRAPVLIGANGPLSFLPMWELYAMLHKQMKPVEFLWFPDGQHILNKPLERIASQQGNVDWFRFWLQGYEDPDPAKAAQYKRWGALRKLASVVTSK